jgi:hypothetical protein
MEKIMKKKMGYCNCCAYFESVATGSGYCHKIPPIIVQNLVKEDEEGGVFYASILNASAFPITFDSEFCGDFLSAEDVEWPG